MRVLSLALILPLLAGCDFGIGDTRKECSTDEELKVEGDEVYECRDQSNGGKLSFNTRRYKKKVWVKLDFDCPSPYEITLLGRSFACIDPTGNVWVESRRRSDAIIAADDERRASSIFCAPELDTLWLKVTTESDDPARYRLDPGFTGAPLDAYFQCTPNQLVGVGGPTYEGYDPYFQCRGEIQVSEDRKTIACVKKAGVTDELVKTAAGWKDPLTELEWDTPREGTSMVRDSLTHCSDKGDGWRLPTREEFRFFATEFRAKGVLGEPSNSFLTSSHFHATYPVATETFDGDLYYVQSTQDYRRGGYVEYETDYVAQYYAAQHQYAVTCVR